jgi:hypothetical protein
MQNTNQVNRLSFLKKKNQNQKKKKKLQLSTLFISHFFYFLICGIEKESVRVKNLYFQINIKILKCTTLKERTRGRNPRTENRGQKIEDKIPRTKNRGQKTEDRKPRTKNRGPKAEDEKPRTKTEDETRGPKPRPKKKNTKEKEK